MVNVSSLFVCFRFLRVRVVSVCGGRVGRCAFLLLFVVVFCSFLFCALSTCCFHLYQKTPAIQLVPPLLFSLLKFFCFAFFLFFFFPPPPPPPPFSPPLQNGVLRLQKLKRSLCTEHRAVTVPSVKPEQDQIIASCAPLAVKCCFRISNLSLFNLFAVFVLYLFGV